MDVRDKDRRLEPAVADDLRHERIAKIAEPRTHVEDDELAAGADLDAAGVAAEGGNGMARLGREPSIDRFLGDAGRKGRVHDTVDLLLDGGGGERGGDRSADAPELHGHLLIWHWFVLSRLSGIC